MVIKGASDVTDGQHGSGEPLDEVIEISSEGEEDPSVSGDSPTENESEDEEESLKGEGTANPKKYVVPTDYVGDISFHPKTGLLAFGDGIGDAVFIRYGVEETTRVHSVECHIEPTRCLDFNLSGSHLYSTSADKNIIVLDTEEMEMVGFYPSAHLDPPTALAHVDDNYFISGDCTGTVKIWDRRVHNRSIFESRKTRDNITAIVVSDDQLNFACAIDDGTILHYDYRHKKLISKTDPIEADVTCMGVFKTNSKLLCGTSTGIFYIYDWYSLEGTPDKFKPFRNKNKIQTECLVPATENIAITGWEDGVIRAMSLYPNKMMGIIGKVGADATESVHCLDISHDGRYIAASTISEISFWDISFLEQPNLDCGEERNLPCSNLNDRENFFSGLEAQNPLEEACGEGDSSR